MAELRAVVMQPDLERLGRYDPERVRRRFLDAFTPAHTRVIQHAGIDVGLVAARPDADALWIEHFYLDPAQQGQGIGIVRGTGGPGPPLVGLSGGGGRR